MQLEGNEDALANFIADAESSSEPDASDIGDRNEDDEDEDEDEDEDDDEDDVPAAKKQKKWFQKDVINADSDHEIDTFDQLEAEAAKLLSWHILQCIC